MSAPGNHVRVTAQRILDAAPTVIQVVPLTSTLRGFHTEVVIEPDPANGLEQSSAAQCQHVRAASPARVVDTLGNVGPLALSQIRETIAAITDISTQAARSVITARLTG